MSPNELESAGRAVTGEREFRHHGSKPPFGEAQLSVGGQLRLDAFRGAPDGRASPAAQLLEVRRQDLQALLVEAVRRLVEEDEVRVVDEGHRQPDPLPLSHREPVGPPIREILEPEDAECPLHRALPACRRHEREPRAEVEVAPCAEPGIEAAITRRQESEPREVRAAIAFGMEPVEGYRARFGMDQAGRDSQQRRLPVPFAPQTETSEPRGTARSTPSRTGSLPHRLWMAFRTRRSPAAAGDAADACDSVGASI